MKNEKMNKWKNEKMKENEKMKKHGKKEKHGKMENEKNGKMKNVQRVTTLRRPLRRRCAMEEPLTPLRNCGGYGGISSKLLCFILMGSN